MLISDYGKGVCTSILLEMHGDRAGKAGVPVLVDPARGRIWSDYGKVTLINANRDEAMGVAAEETRPLAMARRLADKHRCSVVVTYGRHGMVAAEREGGIWYLPAEATEVRDVCGAGDTVMATLGTGMLEGNCLRRACHFALDAASQQIAHVGISSVGEDVGHRRSADNDLRSIMV